MSRGVLRMKKYDQTTKSLVLLLFLYTTLLIAFFTSTTYPGQGVSAAATITTTTTTPNATNIILVHGSWGDGSVWRKEIPILMNAGHRVIAVQLPLQSLADDVATVKRAIERTGGGPTILVGHSYMVE
jgi:pimeloyl-ACP methyl ester carboxylesterase